MQQSRSIALLCARPWRLNTRFYCVWVFKTYNVWNKPLKNSQLQIDLLLFDIHKIHHIIIRWYRFMWIIVFHIITYFNETRWWEVPLWIPELVIETQKHAKSDKAAFVHLCRTQIYVYTTTSLSFARLSSYKASHTPRANLVVLHGRFALPVVPYLSQYKLESFICVS